MSTLVVLIPALNEAQTIGQVIQAVPSRIADCEVRVLVVDDGSTDTTSQIATQFGAQVVRHQTNRGVGQTFQTGLDTALEMGADFLVNIDADGQFSPTEIPKLMQPILDHQAEFVIGDRFTQSDGSDRLPEHMSKQKGFGNVLMSKLISQITGQKFRDVSSGFRAYTRRTLMLLNLTGAFTYTQESFIDLISKGVIAKNVPVTVRYFPERKSRVANNLLKYAWRTLKIIFRAFRDYRPLLFFVILSLPLLLISLLSGGFLFVHFIQTGSFTPYKVVGFIFIYCSALTLVLWIIGFVADMFTRIRLNQERILYLQKRQYYDGRR